MKHITPQLTYQQLSDLVYSCQSAFLFYDAYSTECLLINHFLLNDKTHKERVFENVILQKGCWAAVEVHFGQ